MPAARRASLPTRAGGSGARSSRATTARARPRAPPPSAPPAASSPSRDDGAERGGEAARRAYSRRSAPLTSELDARPVNSDKPRHGTVVRRLHGRGDHQALAGPDDPRLRRHVVHAAHYEHEPAP